MTARAAHRPPGRARRRARSGDGPHAASHHPARPQPPPGESGGFLAEDARAGCSRLHRRVAPTESGCRRLAAGTRDRPARGAGDVPPRRIRRRPLHGARSGVLRRCAVGPDQNAAAHGSLVGSRSAGARSCCRTIGDHGCSRGCGPSGGSAAGAARDGDRRQEALCRLRRGRRDLAHGEAARADLTGRGQSGELAGPSRTMASARTRAGRRR